MRDQESGFRVQALWLRVQGSGFRGWVQDLGFRISGLESGIRPTRLHAVQGVKLQVSRFGFRVSGSGFRSSDVGFRVLGSGFRAPG